MTPQPKAQPKMELARVLWTMWKSRDERSVFGPDRSVTAAIYVTDAGRELRVHYGANINNLLDSLLSREGDAPLEARADHLRSILREQKWSEGCGV